jgi:hypothetical protein
MSLFGCIADELGFARLHAGLDSPGCTPR